MIEADARDELQELLAGPVGINRVSLAKIESRRVEPKASTFLALAAALDVTCEELTEEPASNCIEGHRRPESPM